MVWKDIPGFEGLYQASDSGMIRSLNRVIIRLVRSTVIHQRLTGRLMFRRPLANKYYTVTLAKRGKNYSDYVHRWVAKTFIPNPDGKREVNHKDGKKWNNRVSNLEWVTSAENKQHAEDLGLIVRRGEGCSWSKLNERKVRMVLDLRDEGKPAVVIAKVMGVSDATIRDIFRGATWRHVTGLPDLRQRGVTPARVL
jgi:hypothetical protein